MDKRIPVRTCIGCNIRRPQKEMIRIVQKPGGGLDYDEKGCMSGRGAYLCMDNDCCESAIRKKSFNRVFKTSVSEEEIKRLREDFERAVARRRQCET